MLSRISNLYSNAGNLPQQIVDVKTNWPLLAGVRFCLAMLVLLSHLGGYTDFKPLVHDHQSLYNLANYIGSLGAVMAFFMISGYSIAHSITNRPEQFIVRRIWRIWPTYLFCFFIFVFPVALYQGSPLTQIIGNAFMMQGYLTRILEMFDASWSLAIEELLYLMSPIFRRLSNRALLILIVLSSYMYLHSTKLHWTRFAGDIAGRGFICCAWAWLIGFLYYRNSTKVWAQSLLLFLPVYLMGACNQLPGTVQCSVVLLVAIALIYSSQIKIANEGTNKFLAWLGNVSYQLYICHNPLTAAVVLAMTSLGLSSHAWYGHPYRAILIIFMVSVAIYHFIDAPNRDRWKKPFPLFGLWRKWISKPIEQQSMV